MRSGMRVVGQRVHSTIMRARRIASHLRCFRCSTSSLRSTQQPLLLLHRRRCRPWRSSGHRHNRQPSPPPMPSPPAACTPRLMAPASAGCARSSSNRQSARCSVRPLFWACSLPSAAAGRRLFPSYLSCASAFLLRAMMELPTISYWEYSIVSRRLLTGTPQMPPLPRARPHRHLALALFVGLYHPQISGRRMTRSSSIMRALFSCVYTRQRRRRRAHPHHGPSRLMRTIVIGSRTSIKRMYPTTTRPPCCI